MWSGLYQRYVRLRTQAKCQSPRTECALGLGERELAVGPRLKPPGRHDRVSVERRIDVRERLIPAWYLLKADFRPDTIRVNDQHQQVRQSHVDHVRHRRHLISGRAVDEPFLGQRPAARRSGVLTIALRPLPVGRRGDVVDETHSAAPGIYRHAPSTTVALR